MDWIFRDWHQIVPGPWVHLYLAMISLLCGVVVGLERERKMKPAGLRTMSLICFGACLFTMLSIEFSPGSDRGRIASQVVVGIGFLGSGIILRGERGSISGVTTAATVWAMAAVGMLAGAGYPIGALAASFVIYGALLIGRWAGLRLVGPCRFANCHIKFEAKGGKALLLVEEILEEHNVPLESIGKIAPSADCDAITVRFCNAHRQHRGFLPRLAEMSEITDLTIEGRTA